MAHPEQRQFVEHIAALFPHHFKSGRVLEVGSRNINGTVRDLFSNCDYTGIDCHAGPDVDVVTLAHKYTTPLYFDTVITTEAIEHDPFWQVSLDNALSLLRPRGLFIATWAGPTRPEHGTEKTGEWFGPEQNYYRGIGADEFLAHLKGRLEPVSVIESGADVYALGWRVFDKQVLQKLVSMQ